mmetsp:Transcript_67591/g.197825  ORF Transcript_67591/g.197825 Transcript_67591/m.197825 type:complete len:107 (+) Transcript_67591:404-724(+)
MHHQQRLCHLQSCRQAKSYFLVKEARRQPLHGHPILFRKQLPEEGVFHWETMSTQSLHDSSVQMQSVLLWFRMKCQWNRPQILGVLHPQLWTQHGCNFCQRKRPLC